MSEQRENSYSAGRPFRQFPKPTARQWLRHALLLVLTIVTTTIFGIVMAGPDLPRGPLPPPMFRGWAGSVLLIPWIYFTTIIALVRYALIHREFLKQGLMFSASFLAILTAHESGHYVFCRRYGV